MTEPTHDARRDADPGRHAAFDDRLATLAGLAAAERLAGEGDVASGRALDALYEWLAADARLAAAPAARARTERRAALFADRVLARRASLRLADGDAVRAAGTPPERAAERVEPLADAIARAAAAGCAPLLDLRVAAGDGRLLWEQACERWVTLPSSLPTGRYLAVGVAGDSMLPLLAPGDTLLVRLGAEPAPGAVVVARGRDDGYVVKQVGRVTARSVELRSLNPTYAPFRVRRAPGAVLGVVVLRWRGTVG